MQSVNKNEINYIYSLNNINNTNQNLSFANISDIKGNQESNINKLGIIINKNKNSFSKEDKNNIILSNKSGFGGL